MVTLRQLHYPPNFDITNNEFRIGCGANNDCGCCTVAARLCWRFGSAKCKRSVGGCDTNSENLCCEYWRYDAKMDKWYFSFNNSSSSQQSHFWPLFCSLFLEPKSDASIECPNLQVHPLSLLFEASFPHESSFFFVAGGWVKRKRRNSSANLQRHPHGAVCGNNETSFSSTLTKPTRQLASPLISSQSVDFWISFSTTLLSKIQMSFRCANMPWQGKEAQKKGTRGKKVRIYCVEEKRHRKKKLAFCGPTWFGKLGKKKRKTDMIRKNQNTIGNAWLKSPKSQIELW